MKTLWYITLFILILNHTNISIRITRKIERKVLSWHSNGCPSTLMTLVWNQGCNNPPRQELPWNTKTVVFSLMVPLLPMAGGTSSGTPLELIEAFVPLQSRMMSPPLCSQGSCGHATPLRFYILITSVRPWTWYLEKFGSIYFFINYYIIKLRSSSHTL